MEPPDPERQKEPPPRGWGGSPANTVTPASQTEGINAGCYTDTGHCDPGSEVRQQPKVREPIRAWREVELKGSQLTSQRQSHHFLEMTGRYHVALGHFQPDSMWSFGLWRKRPKGTTNCAMAWACLHPTEGKPPSSPLQHHPLPWHFQCPPTSHQPQLQPLGWGGRAFGVRQPGFKSRPAPH